MAGAQGQSTVREVASLLTSGAVWARVLRVLLMFSLVFWLTLRVERPQAYGAEPGEGSIYDVEIKPDTIGPVGAGQSVDLWAVGKWDETVVTQEAYDETVHHDAVTEEVDIYVDENGNEVTAETEGARKTTKTVVVQEAYDETVHHDAVTETITHEDYNVTRMLKWSVEGNNASIKVEKDKDDEHNQQKDKAVLTIGEGATGGSLVTVTCEVDKNKAFADQYFKKTIEVPISGSGQPDPGESYAYVEQLFVLSEDGGNLEREGSNGLLDLQIDEESTYAFQARALVVPDSNKMDEKEEFICTSTAGLRSQAAEKNIDLPDLEWSVETISSESGGSASIDATTGVLTIEPGMRVKVHCGTDAGLSGGHTGDDVVVNTGASDEPTEGFTLHYDANGGSGTMKDQVIPEGGTGIVAECSFTPPASLDGDGSESGETGDGGEEGGSEPGTGENGEGDASGNQGAVGDGESTSNQGTEGDDEPSGDQPEQKKVVFDSWNTEPDGSGTSYKPGDEFPREDDAPLEADATLYAQWTDKAVGIYTLTYDANGGTGTMDSVEAPEGTEIEVAECAFVPPEVVDGGAGGSGEEGTDGVTDTGTDPGASMGTQAEGDEPGEGADQGTGGNGGAGGATGTDGDPDQSGDATPSEPPRFYSWNTRPDGSGTRYLPGQKITLEADTTLYARWVDDTITGDFTLTYDANGGTGEMEPQESIDGEPVTVAECTFTPPKNRSFAYWCTSLDGMGKHYDAGAVLELKANTTLYAQWERGDGFGCEIDYMPVEMGEWALLTGIAYGTGESSFGFVWEYSKDGGGSWSYVEGTEAFVNNTSPQTLRIKTTAETIGMLVRATVQTSDERSATSDPVEIAEGNTKLFISYEPVKYGETALFSLTSKLKNATYQWQVSHDNQRTWENVEGATGMTLAVPTIEGNLGSFYRVIGTEKDAEKPERSNALMLTATTDDPGPDDPEKDEGDGGTSPDVTPPSGDTSPSVGPGDTSPDVTPSDTSSDVEPTDTSSDVEPTDTSSDVEPTDNTQPTPEPTPEPAPTPQPPANAVPIDIVVPNYPQSDPTKTPVIVDPEVQQRIRESEVVTQEEQEARTPGARWRKLDVVPEPEEVQQLLADNPFAAYALPTFLGVVAAGALERVLSYRRQKRSSTITFKNDKHS